MANNIASYDHLKDKLLFLSDFYAGGEQVRNPSSLSLGTARVIKKNYNEETKDFFYTAHSVRSYLIPFDGEDDNKFNSRRQNAYYFNLVSQVVNAYSDACTNKVSRNLGILEPFLNNDVDYRDSTWSEYVNQVAKMSSLFGMTATYVDFAVPADSVINSRSDFATKGLSPKCILISPLSFAWVVVNHVGDVEQFAWYETITGEQGYASSVIIRIVDKQGWKQVGAQVNMSKNVQEQVAVSGELISEGKHPASLNGKLPIVFCYYDRDYTARYPLGKSLVNDLADTARAVYNYNSWASDTHQKASFPILTVPLARTGGVMPPKTEMAVGVNNALPYDSESGSPSFIAAPSDPTRELREHVNFIIQKAYQQLGLSMVTDSSAAPSSGEALRIRSREFESLASRFANNLKKFEEKVIDLFKLYLGMTEIVTSINYPKTFSIPQTSQDLDNAMTLLSIAFLSDEGKIAALQQVASIALSVSDDELNTIIETSAVKLNQMQVAATTPTAP